MGEDYTARVESFLNEISTLREDRYDILILLDDPVSLSPPTRVLHSDRPLTIVSLISRVMYLNSVGNRGKIMLASFLSLMHNTCVMPKSFIRPRLREDCSGPR